MYPSLLRWEQNVFWIGLRKCNALPATIIFTLILVQHEFWKGEIVFRVQSESPETWDLFLVLGKIRHLPWLLFFILLSVKRSFCCLSTFLFSSWVYSIVSLECYWKSGWGWGRELEKSMWTFMLCKLVMPEYVNIRSVLRITKENFLYNGITISCFQTLVASMQSPISPFPLACITWHSLASSSCSARQSVIISPACTWLKGFMLLSVHWDWAVFHESFFSSHNISGRGVYCYHSPMLVLFTWEILSLRTIFGKCLTLSMLPPPQLKLALNLLLAGKE